MFDLENLLRFSIFSMCTHIKDCFYFYYFSFVYTSIQNNDFCPCFLTDTSVAILNLLFALHVKSTHVIMRYYLTWMNW